MVLAIVTTVRQLKLRCLVDGIIGLHNIPLAALQTNTYFIKLALGHSQPTFTYFEVCFA